MVLHLIRHAKAEPACASDPSLCPEGVEQAGRLARRLGDLGVEQLVHGPARRARQTAELINCVVGPLPLAVLDAARDRTPFPGNDDQVYSSHARAWLDSTPLEERDPRGRALDTAFATLLSMSDVAHLAVVTHAYVIAWCTARALGAPEDAWLRLPVENASVTTLGRNDHGELVVARFNATWP